MRFTSLACQLLASSTLLSVVTATPLINLESRHNYKPIKPKVLLISMFTPEAEIWYGIPEFNLLAKNITIPGLSPLFPDVHCTANHQVCQIITGEAEINAAATVTALVFSSIFDLTKTYFLIAGIGGINPKIATLGSVTFSRYAIQVALQYELDAREKPTDFNTGYFPLGTHFPTTYPQNIYGTEVFEVNQALRDVAIGFAKTAKLNDTDAAIEYRSHYATNPAYKAGSEPPSVLACDVATSDVYWSGKLLGEAFENTTKLFTNGSGLYCNSAEEDNATLEALLRAAIHRLLDFGRIIVLRTASDFDREYDGEAALTSLTIDQGGFDPAIKNIYLAGIKVIEGILHGWNSTFSKGIKAPNYIGDIFNSLGGTPDFGPGGGSSSPSRKRSALHRN
ncbi:hypothetical protein MMC22_008898 [Lobaria immixta]|nr:hypothetical protein [Lobaria immixta]